MTIEDTIRDTISREIQPIKLLLNEMLSLQKLLGDNKIMSLPEAAKKSGINKDVLYKAVKEGKLQCLVTDSSRRKITKTELEKFINRKIND